ncbi:MAG: AtpZ/AtpI family protein [Desulfovibrionales bacterium]
MSDPRSVHAEKTPDPQGKGTELHKDIRRKEQRKMKAREDKGKDLWFGLGTFGMVGWAVAIPMVLLTFLGLWLDARVPQDFSWTLMLMFIGLIIGCLNAWYWINKEHRDIMEDRKINDR